MIGQAGAQGVVDRHRRRHHDWDGAGSLVSAELLRLENSIGVLESGYDGDLIAVERNPLENIANTRTIAAVYQRGKEVDRAAMRANWK